MSAFESQRAALEIGARAVPDARGCANASILFPTPTPTQTTPTALTQTLTALTQTPTALTQTLTAPS